MGKDARNNLRGLPGGTPLFGAGGGRINTQPAEVWDAFGRPLGVGDLIQLHNTGMTGPLLRVGRIERVIESGVPDGIMEIELTARLKFRAPRAQPNQEFVRILTNSEVTQNPEAPPAPPPGGLEDTRDEGELARVEDPSGSHVDGYSGETQDPVERALANEVDQPLPLDGPRVTLD